MEYFHIPVYRTDVTRNFIAWITIFRDFSNSVVKYKYSMNLEEKEKFTFAGKGRYDLARYIYILSYVKQLGLSYS